MSYKQQVRDKLWALLEAHAPVTSAFNPNDRLKKPSVTASLREKLRVNIDTFPKLEITDGRFTHGGFTQPRSTTQPSGMTFEMQNAQSIDDISDWIVARKLVFYITITGRDQTVSIDDAEEAVQDAILLGGPLLGLPGFVSSWDTMTAVRRNEAQTKRPLSIITLPVNLEFSGAALRTQLTA